MARATPRPPRHPPRPHQVYGLQELLEAELLAVVLVQDAEHEVGRGHAVVQVGEQIGELLQRQPAGEVVLKAVIIISVIMMIMILSSPGTPRTSPLSRLPCASCAGTATPGPSEATWRHQVHAWFSYHLLF